MDFKFDLGSVLYNEAICLVEDLVNFFWDFELRFGS